VDEKIIRNDAAEHSAERSKNTNENNAPKAAAAENSAPGLSGADAARFAAKAEDTRQSQASGRRAAKFAADPFQVKKHAPTGTSRPGRPYPPRLGGAYPSRPRVEPQNARARALAKSSGNPSHLQAAAIPAYPLPCTTTPAQPLRTCRSAHPGEIPELANSAVTGRILSAIFGPPPLTSLSASILPSARPLEPSPTSKASPSRTSCSPLLSP
jgi:hypothetical protein